MKQNKFGVLCVLGVIWLVMFIVTLTTHAPVMARGVMPLVSVACVLWFAYWTISLLRGTDKPAEKKEKTTNKQ